MSSTASAPDHADRYLDSLPNAELLQMPRPRTLSDRFRLRVLIASAHPIVRHGLRALLSDASDIDVVAEAELGADAVRLSCRLRPDVVVIDMAMPDLDGITATRLIRAEAPQSHVVITTGVEEGPPAIESIRAGASAYLPKETRTDVLLRAIRDAGAGQIVLPSEAVARLVRVAGRHEAISERESEVMRLVAQGKANKQIARELSIAQSTVKSHVGSLLSKLGLLSRTQLALYAARTGLVALDQRAAMSAE